VLLLVQRPWEVRTQFSARFCRSGPAVVRLERCVNRGARHLDARDIWCRHVMSSCSTDTHLIALQTFFGALSNQILVSIRICVRLRLDIVALSVLHKSTNPNPGELRNGNRCLERHVVAMATRIPAAFATQYQKLQGSLTAIPLHNADQAALPPFPLLIFHLETDH